MVTSALPSTKSNEWYTPARYIEAAREVMGGIDLDPASCELANQTVKASRYYSKEEDGLSKEWYGRVWLNPPFSGNKKASNENRSNIAHWISKLLSHYESNRVVEAILLTTSYTQAKWFQQIWQYPICFADHGVRFNLPYGCTKQSRIGWKTDGHRLGTIFVYLGPHEQKFTNIFSQFGRIAKAIDTPRQEVAPVQLWEVAP